LSALEKKLEDLEEAISSPVSEASGDENVDYDMLRTVIGTTDGTRVYIEATGRGIKRANVKQISSEPSAKKFAEGSPSVSADSSNGSVAESDDSVSE